MSDENILEEAMKIVGGDRITEYGHPTKNFADIALLFNALLVDKLKAPITPRDCVLLMILLKISRLKHKTTRDSWIDIAGYAAVGAIVEGIDELK